MPNWVQNRLVVRGTSELRAEIRATLRGTAGGVAYDLSFQNVIRRPAESDEDWYAWNITNWGTKWDAVDVVVDDDDEHELTYVFSTAWAPPIPVLDALRAKFPAIEFTYEFEEEQGWGGTMEVAAGEIVNETSYDIPESHHDLVERGRTCLCEAVEEQIFDDCFAYRVDHDARLTGDAKEIAKGISREWSGSFGELVDAATKL